MPGKKNPKQTKKPAKNKTGFLPERQKKKKSYRIPTVHGHGDLFDSSREERRKKKYILQVEKMRGSAKNSTEKKGMT